VIGAEAASNARPSIRLRCFSRSIRPGFQKKLWARLSAIVRGLRRAGGGTAMEMRIFGRTGAALGARLRRGHETPYDISENGTRNQTATCDVA